MRSILRTLRAWSRNRAVLTVAIFFLFFFLFLQIKQLKERYVVEKEINALKDQAGQLQKDNQELQDFIAYLKTDSYRQRAIREELNLKKDGEVVYSFAANSKEGDQNQAQEAKVSNPNKWWNYFFAKKQ
jgi:cell division protein FtsB